MRIVILGPNGQLGSDLVRIAGNHRIAGLARPGFELIPLGRPQLDVARVDRVSEVLQGLAFDALVNCTGYHKTDEVEQNATTAFAVNAHAVAQMADVCEAKGARLVHISTDYVFDGSGRRPYAEEDPAGPINVYGASKYMGETLALRGGGDVMVLRVASLFGVAGASGKGGNFVETMVRVGREKGSLRVVNDVTMSPTATEDVAATILRLLAAGAPAGRYHVVNSGQATWFAFAGRIVERAGVRAAVTPITSAEYPTAALRPSFTVLDNRKVQGVVGPLPSWEDSLDRYLAAKGYR